MKKITNRALSVILICALVIGLLGIFIYKDFLKGKDWALYFGAYNSASEGTILDRNGIALARFDGASSTFSDDTKTRIANYHVTGDYWGRTGTGLLSRYWQTSQNYNFYEGTTNSVVSTLNLTIDANINNRAYTLLRENGKGCIMMCNYRTGEVIAMVSSPSVDPLDSEGEVEDGAYINRCLSAAFVPGSTFKLITAAAAIENIPDLEGMTFNCEEEYDVAGVKIKCTVAHGEQTFEEALANSCNCAFARIAVMLGQDTMIKYVTDYGILESHDLNGISCAKGNYPLEFVGDPELAWSGIGQSTDQVCPYTMLRYVCAIAGDGTLIEPTLIKSEDTPAQSDIMDPQTAVRMKSLMANNVKSHYEGEVNFPGLNLCAKTGTAETGVGDNAHSWFVGFLDDETHPYAFVALVENGGFGLWTAGLMMNDLLQYAVAR